MIDWLGHLVEPLNHVIFHLGNDAVSWAELLGFLTGGWCVWLTVLSRISNFPVGIANSALFLVLFASARLWADSALQVVYIALGFIGWWQWLRGGPQRTSLVVGKASRTNLLACAVFVVVATIGLTILLRSANDVAPFWDALTTALSLAAQWLLNAKKIQTWWFWISADCVYIPLYAAKQLDLTALVYVLFLGLCLSGLATWRRALRKHSMDAVAPQSVTA